jgi:hypothetical protein
LLSGTARQVCAGIELLDFGKNDRWPATMMVSSKDGVRSFQRRRIVFCKKKELMGLEARL